MDRKIAAAVFGDCNDAERAIHEMKEAGVPAEAISVVQLHGGKAEMRDADGNESAVDDDHDSKATGVAKGLMAGGALGAVAGVAALLIPGIGPFIAGGALAQTLGAAGSAAVASGALGAAAGGLTGALVDYGFEQKDAQYYEQHIREGGVFVAVDTSSNPSAYTTVRAILRAAGGESAEADERSREHAN